jgi:hypothetical protein
VITPFIRPPHEPSGEDASDWVGRARLAAELAPLAHHTHWGGPTQARPRGALDAAALVQEEAELFRAHGLAPRFFCGGGWYLDHAVAQRLAELDYCDCTATTFRQRYLADEAPRLQLDGPRTLRLSSGSLLRELPATHSLGMLARGMLRLRGLVHVHFHDWELLDRRRALALEGLLWALRARRRPLALDELAERASAAPFFDWPAATINHS